jgi:hypothetical protein
MFDQWSNSDPISSSQIHQPTEISAPTHNEQTIEFGVFCNTLAENLTIENKQTLIELLFPQVGTAKKEEIVRTNGGYEFVNLMREHLLIRVGNVVPAIKIIQKYQVPDHILELLWKYQISHQEYWTCIPHELRKIPEQIKNDQNFVDTFTKLERFWFNNN